MRKNPFSEDCKIDLAYPAQQQSFTFNSDGSLINGFIEIAQGRGPYPTIVLLHGIPGTEKNSDIAHILRRVDFNVVIFSYRGNWGSKGSYNFKNCVIDCENLIKFLKEHHEQYRVKRNEIILIGYSLGGFIALYTAFRNPEITKIASISGFHLQLAKINFQLDKHHKQQIYELFLHAMNAIEGTTPTTLLQEIENIDSWNFENYYAELGSKNLCLIAALKDEIIPPEMYHFTLIKELEQVNPKMQLFTTTFYDANHSYSDHRIKLTKTLLEWLLKKI